MAKLQAAMASPSRSWSTKLYILFALAGTLVATVVVIAVSALFSPAEIAFSITRASHLLTVEEMEINLIVAAANPGWRAGVEYNRFDVWLQYTPENGVPTLLSDTAASAPLHMPFVQPPRNTTTVPVPVSVVADYWKRYLDGETKRTTISVLLKTTVRFMIGMKVCTRSYDIAVLCNLGYALVDNATASFDNGTVNCDEAPGELTS